MRNNPMVKGVNLAGTPNKGDNKPDANMPANNHGTFPVTLAAGQKSKFGTGTGPSTAQGGTAQSATGGKANMPSHNAISKNVVLGHTKHAVGEVPGYLKGNH
jgi:hypothetical protein